MFIPMFFPGPHASGGLTLQESENLATCAKAAQLVIQADKDRRADRQAAEDAKTQAEMTAYIAHLKTLSRDQTQPPSTSFFSR